MKRAAIAGLLILVLFGAGEEPRLVALIDMPAGTSFEIASERVTCASTRTDLDVRFGERDDCRSLCEQDPRSADGSYLLRAGVASELVCAGPRGSVPIPGTGTLDEQPIVFCADRACTRLLDYCDCYAPNLTAPSSDAWYSEPFEVEVTAIDNHEMRSIESTTTQRCDGSGCSKNVTVPIGAACSQTGTGTCAVHVNATDAWENAAETVLRYNVDLNAPIARHEWLGEGVWHKDQITIRFEAHEPTEDESGVSGVWIADRTGDTCPEVGSEYTRYTSPVELSFNDDGEGRAFCYYATDRAIPANRGEVHRTERRYADTTPPRIELEPSGALHNENKIIYARCSDDESGCLAQGHVHMLANESCPDPSDPRYRTAPLETECESGSCAYRVCAWARDRVGHETFIERELMIDLTEPSIEIVSQRTETERLVLELLVSDSGSGLASCSVESSHADTFECDVQGAITSLTVPIECPRGECSYTIRITDRAGNEAILDRHTSI